MPEREYDEDADTWGSWWLAHRAIGEMVKAGMPLPDMFKGRPMAKQQVQRKPTNHEASVLRMIARTRLIKMHQGDRKTPVWVIENGVEISDACARSLISHGWIIAQRDGLSMFDESQTYHALKGTR